ncbi:hypothetical protein AK812_SmicGene40893 [Symbiodinium microadriaticum]|uniref:Uncharacterized protein n=1 Tax=Symbiodinium microadriaticum TaxID=2951 RepID=A0A1Q9C7J0_SYMMI|nr:hypothetical protein AK812_SmicGene40893 [Symbiodinium microadriaticum]
MAVVLLPGSVEEEEALTVINAARQDLLVGQHVGKQWDATKTSHAQGSTAQILRRAIWGDIPNYSDPFGDTDNIS